MWVWQTDRQKSETWKLWKYESDRLTDKQQRLEIFENMSLTDWHFWKYESDRLTDQNNRHWIFEIAGWQTDRPKWKMWKIWKYESDRLTDQNERHFAFENSWLTDWQTKMRNGKVFQNMSLTAWQTRKGNGNFLKMWIRQTDRSNWKVQDSCKL